MDSIKPIVKKIEDNVLALQDFQDSLMKESSDTEREVLLNFPTVYIHNWKET